MIPKAVTTPPAHLSFPAKAQAGFTEISSYSMRLLLKDVDYIVGLCLLLVSCAIFVFADPTIESSLFGTFAINYLIAIGYTIWLLVTGKMRFFWRRQRKQFQTHRLLLWTIWLVSCFALNRVIPIFNPSTLWLSSAVVLTAMTCILFSAARILPLFLRKVLYFCFGASTVLTAYFTIYLCWLYPLSIPFLLFFGLSFHSFIPLILLIAHVKIIIRKWRLFKIPILTGIIAPIVFLVYFSLQWYTTIYKIRYAVNDVTTSNSNDMPQWIRLGQILENDWITERLIKGQLVYQMPPTHFSFVPQGTNFRDLAEHDPLVLLASMLSPKIDLSESERIKLLDVLFDARHYTQERLWSGRNLRTANVVTHARIYPEYQIAYTEKTISIASNARSRWSSQEALYTFYLPEGAVVSSLSLWINDKEEKGYLTSRTKADSAYKTIVGVESRDPSVIHWQEGSTVKVKVFPCTPKENRRFKIGVTAPLKSQANKLIYENIYFQGPASEDATESIKLEFTKNVAHTEVPFPAEIIDGKSVTSHGRYRPSWEVSFDKVPLATGGLVFQGKTYTVRPYQNSAESFAARRIYLDINGAWTREEFDQIYDLLKNRNLYIYDDGFIRLADANKEKLFEKLHGNRYTLFPVHKLPDVATSLLITKGTPTSPNLKDLQGSKFGDDIKSWSHGGVALRTFNLGNLTSAYFKTLKELRMIRSENVEVNEIRKFTGNGLFPADQESETSLSSTLRIGEAGFVISESDKPVTSTAPDHLLRLFAYNHIMKQIGPQYLEQKYLKTPEVNASLVNEAAKANIVTPVSSLIVLETEEDYKRFNIEKSRNSLDNATMKNYGAVPEPHEWLLIALFLLFVSYYTFRGYVR